MHMHMRKCDIKYNSPKVRSWLRDWVTIFVS